MRFGIFRVMWILLVVGRYQIVTTDIKHKQYTSSRYLNTNSKHRIKWLIQISVKNNIGEKIMKTLSLKKINMLILVNQYTCILVCICILVKMFSLYNLTHHRHTNTHTYRHSVEQTYIRIQVLYFHNKTYKMDACRYDVIIVDEIMYPLTLLITVMNHCSLPIKVVTALKQPWFGWKIISWCQLTKVSQ